MSTSDWHQLRKVTHWSHAELDKLTLYKACVAVSNNGTIHNLELNLPPPYRQLLDVRRAIHQNRITEALRDLKRFNRPLSDILAGDRLFLIGIVYHRLGRIDQARRFFLESSEIFAVCDESHRRLRAIINAEMSTSVLGDYLCGKLYALEQEAYSLEFYDLVANIRKSRAIELMNVGRLKEALAECQSSVDAYCRDGCPEDKAVALLISAILHVLLGDTSKAEEKMRLVHAAEGKLESYYRAYTALTLGRRPKFSQGHPLAKMDWKFAVIRLRGVTGRIVAHLRQGPRTRDEMIEWLWPGQWSPSHCQRLYSAINILRKKWGLTIVYDGENYTLL